MSFIIDYFSTTKVGKEAESTDAIKEIDPPEFVTILTKNGHPVKVSRSEKDIEDMLNKEVSSLETSSYTCKRNGKAVFVYDKNKLIYMYSVIILPLN